MLNKEKIAVGFSGGVDSTAALWLLKKSGYMPIAITFDFANIFSKDEERKIKKIAEKIGVKHLFLKKDKVFKNEVINYFLEQTEKLKTPNPCIICNPNFKIKELLLIAKKFNAKKIATGHYAKVLYNKKGNYFYISPAKDKKKDQSYFLIGLKQSQLKNLILPLGEKNKVQAEVIYKKFALLPKQSQNLCFLKSEDKNDFIARNIGKIPCQMVFRGKAIKKCSNIYNYTLGQRKGLGLAGGPFYIVEIKRNKKIVYLSRDKRDALSKVAILSKVNFFNKNLLKRQKKINILAKARYQMEYQKAVLKKDNKYFEITFRNPVFALTPGQFIAFYSLDKKACLGGGEIKRVVKNEK